MTRVLTFRGYAALWDRVDRAGDVFRQGAFAEACGRGEVPLLWQHRGAAVGRAMVAADATGLCICGEIEDAALARLVGCGAVDGLSVGYRPTIVQQGAWREILRAELVEVSLVAQPMQPGARVEGVEYVADASKFA